MEALLSACDRDGRFLVERVWEGPEDAGMASSWRWCLEKVPVRREEQLLNSEVGGTLVRMLLADERGHTDSFRGLKTQHQDTMGESKPAAADFPRQLCIALHAAGSSALGACRVLLPAWFLPRLWHLTH